MDVASLAEDARRHGLVVLAGAGLSMAPPSSLPGWSAINNAFLEALAMRISLHTDGEVGSFQVAGLVAGQRDEVGVAAPDLQAQFGEESLGDAYYRLFEPLDVDAWNDGHAALAAIARSGVLRAVVTTNFDRLVEHACAAAGVATEVFASATEFGRFDADAPPSASLAIIKAHGSVERRDTIVDTLRQRVVGRPVALETALERLFGRHAVLVVGLSGADLAYDPHYLRLRAGAQASPSFTFVVRTGERPRPEISDLTESAPRLRLVEGDLPDLLVDLADELGQRGPLVGPRWDAEMDFPGIRAAGLSAASYYALEKSVSPVQATVALAEIVEAANSTDAALRLLQATMPHHGRAGLLGDPAMPRQVAMIAERLIGLGFLDPQLAVELGDDASALTALAVLSLREVDLDAEGVALLALAHGLRDDAPRSDAFAVQALRGSREIVAPGRRADVVGTLARTWILAERWEPPMVAVLRDAYDAVAAHGDEPRRLRLGALLGRFLIEFGDLDTATRLLLDCQRASRRLRIATLQNDLVALGGRLHLASGRPEEAVRMLTSVYGHFDRSVMPLRCAQTVIPLREAAAAVGDHALLRSSADPQRTALRMFPGLRYALLASGVRILCRVEAFAEAREHVAAARDPGGPPGEDVWLERLAARLEHDLDGFSASG